MSQSSTIAFFLIAGFIVFITMRGELTKYVNVIFTLTPSANASTSSTPNTTPNVSGLASDFLGQTF